MSRAPLAATPSGVIALTLAAVPTGINTGVSTSPCAVERRPSRAMPSHATISKPMLMPGPVIAHGRLAHSVAGSCIRTEQEHIALIGNCRRTGDLLLFAASGSWNLE